MNQSSKLLLKLGEYKMRTQIMLLLTILVVFIAALSTTLTFINLIILERYFTQSSNQIFIKESINQIQRNSAFYLSQLNRVFEISKKIFTLDENELKSLASIYVKAKKQVEQMPDFVIQENINYNLSGTAGIPIELQDPKNWGNYPVSYSVQCYSNTTIFPDPLTSVYKKGIKIQEYFISIGQIIHQSKTTNQGQYYGYFEADQILTNFPCVSLGKDVFNYKPTKRSWYKKAQELYKKSENSNYVTAFTEPYLQYTIQQIGIALVLPVVDENKQFLGAWGTNIVFQKILDIFKIEDQKVEKMFLINSDGILLMHSFGQDLKQFPIYFYNESLTGFNQEDWDQIQNQEKISNCNNTSSFTKKQQSSSQIVCRYNSKFDKEFLIGITLIEKYNMKLVMMIGSKEIQSFNKDFTLYLQRSVNLIIEQYFIQFLAVLSILCALIAFIIYYVFQPIENIIKVCYSHILSNNKSLKKKQNPNDMFDIAKLILSKQIRNLYITFMSMFDKLNQLSLTKSQYCRFLEQLKFPSKNRNKHESQLLNKIRLFRHNHFTKKFSNEDSISFSIMIYLQQSQSSQSQ